MGAATGSWNLLVEVGPPIEPHEVTEAILWLVSDTSDFVTGSSLVGDGGFLAK
ncbi:MAG: SDR family oxidoreductase [Comamonadaceae bacterium]|nr:MAG: SDR family oxidoreductase [Comamonadaceae bacterium]